MNCHFCASSVNEAYSDEKMHGYRNACKILIGLNTKRPMSPIMKFLPEMSTS